MAHSLPETLTGHRPGHSPRRLAPCTLALLAAAIGLTALPVLTPTAARAGTSVTPQGQHMTTTPFRTRDCEASTTVPFPSASSRAAAAPPLTLEQLREQPPYRDGTAEADAARQSALRQSAKSLGMRAGFNRGIYCHQLDLGRLAGQLDRQYDFVKLLYDAGSGQYWEPGIIVEHGPEFISSEDQRKVATTSSRSVIKSRELLVRTARNWRDYLIVDIEPLAPEHPKNRPASKDRDQWEAWVNEGWQSGLQQAADTMNHLWSELDQDFLGMLAFRRYAAEQKLMLPRVVVTNRGVTGNDNEVRIDDTEVEIKRPSGLNPNPAKWRAIPFVAPSAPPSGPSAPPAPQQPGRATGGPVMLTR